jgi:hypothetical protein
MLGMNATRSRRKRREEKRRLEMEQKREHTAQLLYGFPQREHDEVAAVTLWNAALLRYEKVRVEWVHPIIEEDARLGRAPFVLLVWVKGISRRANDFAFEF